ncbi:MAG: MarR family transcriptional regulator [Deltaproteobacteria bacterium]|nr:MarR family transcriptional regulator [Deltaproteobacteria bacterium]
MLGSAHASLGVTNSQVHALLELETDGTLSVIEIARRLRLEKSSTSRLVDGMVHLGLVRVDTDTVDGRRKLISLTKDGRKCVKAIHDQANSRVQDALSTLSAEEQRRVEDGLSLYASALAATGVSNER